MNGIVEPEEIQNAEFLEAMATSVGAAEPGTILAMCLPVLVFSFLVTLLVTPLYRRLAFAFDIVDRPNDPRKIHAKATPYLGGLAVATGLLAGLILSYPLSDQWPIGYRMVPIWIVVGMLIICLTGLLDDVTEFDSWIKVSGMLAAAAGLAVSNVGTRVAAGRRGPSRNAPPRPSAPADNRAWLSADGTRLTEPTVAQSPPTTFPRRENRFIHLPVCRRPWRGRR